MKKVLTLLALALGVITTVKAQGFVDEPTCYSWNGGDKSAGSFVKCNPSWNAKPAPKPAVAPVVQTQALPPAPVCPPHIILQPEPKKPAIKRKPRPKPLTC